MNKTIKKIIIGIISILIAYILLVILLPHIGVRAETVQKIKEINIYIKSNGVHTDIVLPLKNKYYNWTIKFKQKHTPKPSDNMKLIAIGWGDQGFYLNTPTWSDLTIKTACTAAFGLGTTALHTTYYQNLKEDGNCVKITLTPEQYNTLCNYIIASAPQKNGEFINIKTNANYGNHDAFYKANGTYHVFKTCNTWTNNALKVCGQNACLWTVTDKQILIKNQ